MKKGTILSVPNLGVQSNLISMISVRTLRRYLHKSGLSVRVSARKPLLSKLQWFKTYSSFEATDWNQVIFSAVMFGDREIADTTAIIPARQLNMEAYQCWFRGN